MDISSIQRSPGVPLTPLESSSASKQMSEQQAVELKTQDSAVKPQQPVSVDSTERLDQIRKKYQRKFEWYTDDEGDLKVKIRDGTGEVVQYIPPETVTRMMKDLSNPSGNYVNTTA
jgi:uncharacterized FlaG/YvyC family protein